MQPGWAEPSVPARPFGSTGPQGHRGRMRCACSLPGPDSLADYELIEMLLFLGIPRRDTKPFAKALLNRFGSLLGTLSAPSGTLAEAGLNEDSQRVWALVQEAGTRLARAETDLPAAAQHAGEAVGVSRPTRPARPPGPSGRAVPQ